jgi:hypothetical protein
VFGALFLAVFMVLVTVKPPPNPGLIGAKVGRAVLPLSLFAGLIGYVVQGCRLPDKKK